MLARPLPRLTLLFLLAPLPAAQTTGLEVGADDFRISSMGPDGDAAYDGTLAAVARDPLRNRFLVVWQAGPRTRRNTTRPRRHVVVPADTALCGMELTFQALHLYPGRYTLSNAVDATVGG